VHNRIKSVLIIADIEGSSGCWSYKHGSFLTDAWCRACVEMTWDVNAVVATLFDARVEKITVQDFHRTGYNLLPERIDSRARVLSGYRRGPVPGIGNPGRPDAVIFLGMHAPSGSDGFLAHTLTSRIRRLDVNGRLMAEVELFSASLAPYGIRPIFFSGCPVACAQASQVITGINVYPIDKTGGPARFAVGAWRTGLSRAAEESLSNVTTKPYSPKGPFKAILTMRDGEDQARKLATRWGFSYEGPEIFIETPDIQQLYEALIRLCYLTPFTEKVLPFALALHNIAGRYGLAMVRRRLQKEDRIHP
jgi:D-aminopeptidase